MGIRRVGVPRPSGMCSSIRPELTHLPDDLQPALDELYELYRLKLTAFLV